MRHCRRICSYRELGVTSMSNTEDSKEGGGGEFHFFFVLT